MDRQGFKPFGEFPHDEQLVAMIEHQGAVFVATHRGVYRLERRDGQDVFVPLLFAELTEGILVALEPNQEKADG